MTAPIKDRTGKRYGRIVVIRLIESRPRGLSLWLCRCNCGTVLNLTSKRLSNKAIESCGCKKIEVVSALKNRLTHGMVGTPEYRSWQHMKERCLNKKSKSYPAYGGRGIKICQEWIDSFEAFLKSVGNRPSTRHSIDRFPDNNGNYEPGNVRWATASEQARNRRTNNIIELNGQQKTLAEWSESTGISVYTIMSRLYQSKWSVEKSLTTPVRH